jgi:hypothetical protein
VTRIHLVPDNPLRHRRWRVLAMAVLFWLLVLLLTGCYADTFEGWSQVEGAIICAAVGCFVLAVVLVAIQHWRDSRLWRRLVRAHGGDEASAMATLRMLEEDHQHRVGRAWRRALREDVQ